MRRRWSATLVPTVLPVLDDNMKNDETLPDTADTDLVVATHTGQQRVTSDRDREEH